MSLLRPQHYLPTGLYWDIAVTLLHASRRLGYLPRLRTPRSLNEYILSQKLHFKSDMKLARTVTDKIMFKEWLVQHGFADLVVPTAAILRDTEEARAWSATGRFVVKPTHSSGKALLLAEHKHHRLSEAQLVMLAGWLKEDYYLHSREINYRLLERAIIIEEMVCDRAGRIPNDYKLFCAAGEPFIIQVDYDRFSRPSRQLYDCSWNLLPYSQNIQKFPRDPQPRQRPTLLHTMLQRARDLSASFYFCRVDFYLVGEDSLKAGEITFFPGNGASRFTPSDGDFHAGLLVAKALAEGEIRHAQSGRPPATEIT